MTQVSVFSSTFNPATFSELALHKRQITKFQLTTFFLSLYAHNNAPKNYTSTAKTKCKCWRWKCQNWTTCCDSVLCINPCIHQWYLVWLWYSTKRTQQTDEAFTSDTWYDCDILQTKHNREKMKWIHYTETQLFYTPELDCVQAAQTSAKVSNLNQTWSSIWIQISGLIPIQIRMCAGCLPKCCECECMINANKSPKIPYSTMER